MNQSGCSIDWAPKREGGLLRVEHVSGVGLYSVSRYMGVGINLQLSQKIDFAKGIQCF